MRLYYRVSTIVQGANANKPPAEEARPALRLAVNAAASLLIAALLFSAVYAAFSVWEYLS